MTKNSYDFYLKNLNIFNENLLNFHWNITGENFISLHEWFGSQYKEILDYIDRIAENIKYQDSYPLDQNNDDKLLFKNYASKDYSSSDALRIIYNDYIILEKLTRDLITFSQSKKDFFFENIFYELSEFIANKMYFLKQLFK